MLNSFISYRSHAWCTAYSYGYVEHLCGYGYPIFVFATNAERCIMVRPMIVASLSAIDRIAAGRTLLIELTELSPFGSFLSSAKFAWTHSISWLHTSSQSREKHIKSDKSGSGGFWWQAMRARIHFLCCSNIFDFGYFLFYRVLPKCPNEKII